MNTFTQLPICHYANRRIYQCKYAATHTYTHTDTHTQPYYGPFFWTTRMSWFPKKSSGLYGAREDVRGTHTSNPDGCHSIRTKQQPTSLVHPFLHRMLFLPNEMACVSERAHIFICHPTFIAVFTSQPQTLTVLWHAPKYSAW